MIMTLRPSKTFLFETLARELGKVRGGYGLDAASAHMKNRWMFKTDAYVALDIDEAALRAGLKKAAGDPNVYALKADLAGPLPLTTGFFRAVVTTNTLSHLGDGRKNAVSELIRLTDPDGVLLCEIPRDDGSLHRQLTGAFRDVRPIYFKNAFSRAYEGFFERDNKWLGTHPVAGSRPFLLLSWLIGRLEYLTCRFPAGNRHVLYVCRKKYDASRPDEHVIPPSLVLSGS